MPMLVLQYRRTVVLVGHMARSEDNNEVRLTLYRNSHYGGFERKNVLPQSGDALKMMKLFDSVGLRVKQKNAG